MTGEHQVRDAIKPLGTRSLLGCYGGITREMKAGWEGSTLVAL